MGKEYATAVSSKERQARMSTAHKRRFRAIAIPLVWLSGAAGVIGMGFRYIDPYGDTWDAPPPPPYPIYLVLILLFIMATHAVMVYFLLRPQSYQRSWLRALLALMASGMFFQGALFLGGTHIPPAYAAYLLWALLAGVALLLLFLWSAGSAMVALVRAQRSGLSKVP